MLYATQNYDLEEQKCSVKLQREHDIQHLGQTELFHWAAFDSCVVLIWMVALVLKHLTWVSLPFICGLVLPDPLLIIQQTNKNLY